MATSSKAGFLSLSTTNIWGWMICFGAILILYDIYRIPGLYPLDASSSSYLPVMTTKNVSRYCQMSKETKLSPAENHCYKTPQTHKKYILYDHLVSHNSRQATGHPADVSVSTRWMEWDRAGKIHHHGK